MALRGIARCGATAAFAMRTTAAAAASVGASTSFIPRAQHLHVTRASLDTMPVRMPALSPTMTEGTVIEWYKAEGEEVTAGDVLFDIETDKATMAVEATEDGYLAKVLVQGGTEGVKINSLVALMVEDEGEEPEDIVDDEAAAAAAGGGEEEEVAEKVVEAPVAATAAAGAASAPAQIPAASTTAPAAAAAAGAAATTRPLPPATLWLLKVHNLDASQIPATGPRGHLTKGDVLAFLDGGVAAAVSGGGNVSTSVVAESSTPAAAPAAPAATGGGHRRRRRQAEPYTDIPASGMRKTIAARLTESKTTVPHAYASVDVDVTQLLAQRKAALASGVPKFSLNDVIIKAAGLALRAVPEVNATLAPSGNVERLGAVDISVAVATPGGLITPIVTSADARGVNDIASTVAELAGRAREGGLAPHEYQGGSFSISNLGMFGVTSFSAVINPPQACILAVGTGKPVASGLNNTSDASTAMSFTLSCDARVVDDAQAANWLAAFKGFLEQPATLMPRGPVDQFE